MAPLMVENENEPEPAIPYYSLKNVRIFLNF